MNPASSVSTILISSYSVPNCNENITCSH